MGESNICRWATCSEEIPSDRYLCDKHLAIVFKENKPLRATVNDLALGLGLGVAGNVLYAALTLAYENLNLIQSPEVDQLTGDFAGTARKLESGVTDVRQLHEVVSDVEEMGSYHQEMAVGLLSELIERGGWIVGETPGETQARAREAQVRPSPVTIRLKRERPD